MKPIENILLVEDNPGDAVLLREMFNDEHARHCKLKHVLSMKDAEASLSQGPVDVILLDLGLPDSDGLEAIRRIRGAAPRVPLVVLTGLDDDSIAAQALQEGAQDFLIKGQIETRGLLRAMRYANERKRLEWMKDEFVSSVSHELRTPLTSISASLGLLMANAAGTLPEAAVRLLKIAYTNSQRLVRLINDILDIEKMESGQVTFAFSRVEVRALVDEAIDANRGFAETSDVRIRRADDQSACDDARADPDRLSQVITNLLSNAIKFSPPKGEVEVAIENGPGTVRISVRDHGPGILAAFRPRVFERFAQADASDARLRGGTGLGLSIVKQIVDRLGGSVDFADAPGGGTIFSVTLPCWVEVPSAAAESPAQSAPMQLSHR
ncbi:MAG: hybrid sensor histidine kinase/response regulator [Pseudolabrys sp.]